MLNALINKSGFIVVINSQFIISVGRNYLSLPKIYNTPLFSYILKNTYINI